MCSCYVAALLLAQAFHYPHPKLLSQQATDAFLICSQHIHNNWKGEEHLCTGKFHFSQMHCNRHKIGTTCVLSALIWLYKDIWGTLVWQLKVGLCKGKCQERCLLSGINGRHESLNRSLQHSLNGHPAANQNWVLTRYSQRYNSHLRQQT